MRPRSQQTATSRLINHLRTHRVATVDDLRSAGVSTSTVSRHRRTGVLRSLGPGVVGLADDPDPWRQRLDAARLLNPDAVVSHQSAAQLLGINFHDDTIHLTLDLSQRVRGHEVTGHRTADLTDDDRTSVGGIAVTSVARTLCDLAAVTTSDLHYGALIRTALDDGLVTQDALRAVAERLVGSGRRGAARRDRVLAPMVAPDRPATRSVLERSVDAIIERAGIEGVVRQFVPEWATATDHSGGRVAGVVDFAIPAAKLIIEVDGRAFHETREAFERDRARDRVAAEHGWRVIRFTWAAVHSDPDGVADSIIAAAAVT